MQLKVENAALVPEYDFILSHLQKSLSSTFLTKIAFLFTLTYFNKDIFFSRLNFLRNAKFVQKISKIIQGLFHIISHAFFIFTYYNFFFFHIYL